MEAGEIVADGNAEKLTGYPHGTADFATTLVQAEHSAVVSSPTANKLKNKTNHQDSQHSVGNNTPPSVSNCYVFKSRLQEYAQRAGLPIPVYETIKEGPSHEPSFRSTVIVDGMRYDSLPGFFNRKAAEQSAAEVALLKLVHSGDMKSGISLPVHETGLCKNLLQEYAQKMNYAIPWYTCQKHERQGKTFLFSCTVEIGGIKYIGGTATTKKEAEIKAARTALVAIQSATPENHADDSLYTVLPSKKKVNDLGISTQERAAGLKPKKGKFKKNGRKRRPKKKAKSGKDKKEGVLECQSGVGSVDTNDGSLQNKIAASLEVNMECQTGTESLGIVHGSFTSEIDGGSDVNMGCVEGTDLVGGNAAVGSQYKMAGDLKKVNGQTKSEQTVLGSNLEKAIESSVTDHANPLNSMDVDLEVSTECLTRPKVEGSTEFQTGTESSMIAHVSSEQAKVASDLEVNSQDRITEYLEGHTERLTGPKLGETRVTGSQPEVSSNGNLDNGEVHFGDLGFTTADFNPGMHLKCDTGSDSVGLKD